MCGAMSQPAAGIHHKKKCVRKISTENAVQIQGDSLTVGGAGRTHQNGATRRQYRLRVHTSNAQTHAKTEEEGGEAVGGDEEGGAKQKRLGLIRLVSHQSSETESDIYRMETREFRRLFAFCVRVWRLLFFSVSFGWEGD